MPHIGNFPPKAEDFLHNELSGIGPNDHHTPPKEYPKPLSIPPTDFVSQLDSQDWQIDPVGLRNRVATVVQYFRAPVHLPHGAVVTKLTLYGYRLAAGDLITLTLDRNDRVGNAVALATLSADWTGGYGSKYDDTIEYATIDNENYDYSLTTTISPDTSADDVRLTGVLIDWQ